MFTINSKNKKKKYLKKNPTKIQLFKFPSGDDRKWRRVFSWQRCTRETWHYHRWKFQASIFSRFWETQQTHLTLNKTLMTITSRNLILQKCHGDTKSDGEASSLKIWRKANEPSLRNRLHKMCKEKRIKNSRVFRWGQIKTPKTCKRFIYCLLCPYL